MAIEVRRAGPEDWPIVRDLRLAALQEAPYAFGSSYARERDRVEADWRAWIEHPGAAKFIATDDGRPVGIDGVYMDDEQQPRLVAMWVDPGARRRGAGRALTQAAIDFARAAGAAHLTLDVTETNERAVALYESLGFARTGRRTPLHSDPTLTTLEMRLPIRATER